MLPSLSDCGHAVDPRRGPASEWQKDPAAPGEALHKVEIERKRWGEGEREGEREGVREGERE